jgi:hypothetical protein
VPGAAIAPGVAIALVRQNGTMTHKVRALIDSGCDTTSFPVDWAAELGIDLGACNALSGLTAAGKDSDLDEADRPRHWPTGVEIIFMGQKLKVGAIFRPHLVPVLLGRDFFSHFQITFDDRNRRFWMKPNP